MDSLNRTFYGIETQGMAIGIEDSWGVLIVPFMELKLQKLQHTKGHTGHI